MMGKMIWNKSVHPKLSFLNNKFFHTRAQSADKMPLIWDYWSIEGRLENNFFLLVSKSDDFSGILSDLRVFYDG